MAPGDDHPRIAPSASAAAMVSYHDHLLGLITQITGSTQTLAPGGKCRRPLASSSPPSPRCPRRHVRDHAKGQRALIHRRIHLQIMSGNPACQQGKSRSAG
jgi:hypothetical protein